MPDGSFSLPARLYLLAWDTGLMRLTGSSDLAFLVRAGALTELAQRGALADDDGIARPVGDTRTGDPVLDGLLELIEESRPRTWQRWVTYHAKYTLEAVRNELLVAGYLRTRQRALFSRAQYELDRPDVVKSLIEEARTVLTGPVPVTEVSEQDAALVALATAAGLRTLATGTERKQHKERIEALGERSGTAALASKRAVEDVRTAVSMSVTSTIAASGGG
ncbi:GPP34 family phosphoprotein [Streptomyces sp. NPDC020681]|uniref:GOLPH3/VPS74 family protein n=1 Tax=Streptomyces sp. NPDC020681 TaxID=3365083 RepID=UPI0037B39A6A